MKTVKVFFHSYWFICILNYKITPLGIFIIQKALDFISYILNPIPLNKIYGDLGYFFWIKASLPFSMYSDKFIKGTVIRLPWKFAKENFPEDYEKWKERGLIYDEKIRERIKASSVAYHEWKKAYDKVSPLWMREYIKLQENLKKGI